MKRFLALLLVGALLVLPIATADDSGTQGDNPQSELSFTPFPQVYVNVSNSASFNVSYVGLVLITTSGVYYSFFPADRWTIHRTSNLSVTYQSQITFSHLDVEHINLLVKRYNITNLPPSAINHENGGEDLPSIQANVSVTMSKVHVQSPLKVANNSTNVTGFKLSFSISSSHISGPGDLYLIQTLGAKINNIYQDYNPIAEISETLGKQNGSAIGFNSSSYSAYYWWGPTYTINGHTANLTYTSSQVGSSEVIDFQFQFNNGITSLTQDPYFSIPKIDLFNNPILQKDIQTAANYVILHIELFSAGLISGLALIGLTYASYRRKRF